MGRPRAPGGAGIVHTFLCTQPTKRRTARPQKASRTSGPVSLVEMRTAHSGMFICKARAPGCLRPHWVQTSGTGVPLPGPGTFCPTGVPLTAETTPLTDMWSGTFCMDLETAAPLQTSLPPPSCPPGLPRGQEKRPGATEHRRCGTSALQRLRQPTRGCGQARFRSQT